MPTPASLAMDSRVTSGPLRENAATAAPSSSSRLRCASARSGLSAPVTFPSLARSRAPLRPTPARDLLIGGSSDQAGGRRRLLHFQIVPRTAAESSGEL